jgi:hypothetical protein
MADRIPDRLLISMLEPFGVESKAGVPADAPSFPPFYTSGGTVPVLKFGKSGKFKNSDWNVAYAPLSVQTKLIRAGWTPARIIAANRTSQYYANTISGIQNSLIVEMLVIARAISFQKPKTPVYVPISEVVYGGVILGTIGGYVLKYEDALSKLGNPVVVDYPCADLKSAAGGTEFYKIDPKIVEITQAMLGGKKVPFFFDVENNWTCFSDLNSSDVPENARYLPLPPNSIRYSLLGTDVYVREKASKSSKELTTISKPMTLLNWSTVGPDYSGVFIAPGTYGYVSTKLLGKPADCQNWFGVVNTEIKSDTPVTVITPKDVAESQPDPEIVKVTDTNTSTIPETEDTPLSLVLPEKPQIQEQKKPSYSKYIAGGAAIVCLVGAAFVVKKYVLPKKSESV